MSWTTLIHWLQGPLGIVAACWAFSALLHTLTPPDATSGRLYATFYGIVQFIGANFALIFGRPLPPVVTVTTTETVEKQSHPSATVTTTVETTQTGSAAPGNNGSR